MLNVINFPCGGKVMGEKRVPVSTFRDRRSVSQTEWNRALNYSTSQPPCFGGCPPGPCHVKWEAREPPTPFSIEFWDSHPQPSPIADSRPALRAWMDDGRDPRPRPCVDTPSIVNPFFSSTTFGPGPGPNIFSSSRLALPPPPPSTPSCHCVSHISCRRLDPCDPLRRCEPLASTDLNTHDGPLSALHPSASLSTKPCPDSGRGQSLFACDDAAIHQPRSRRATPGRIDCRLRAPLCSWKSPAPTEKVRPSPDDQTCSHHQKSYFATMDLTS